MKVLHIIDGYNIAHRGGHFGKSYVYGSELKDGVYGPASVPNGAVQYMLDYVVGITKNIFLDPTVEHSYVICLDSKGPTNKRLLNNEYKAARTIKPEECIHQQIDYAEKLFNLYGYTTARVEGFEADDIAYSVWRASDLEYDKVCLHTSDKDWAFMLNQRTFMITHKKGQLIAVTPENYAAVWGVYYNLMTIYKVLRGDPSDNVKGIGMKYMPMLQQARPADLSSENLGNVVNIRRLFIAAGEQFKEFPIDDALRILDLVTPEGIDVTNIMTDIAASRPKSIPHNYLGAVSPNTRDDTHRDLFYEFVEATKNYRR